VGATGNASRGSVWRDEGRKGRMAAPRGRGASARNRACGKAGKRGKRAGDAPYGNAELIGHLVDGGKRRSGGASGSRGAVVAGLRG
jgi:hypothetical protein